MNKIDRMLTRGVANIIPSKEELEKKLRSGKKLNVYFGIDPTATKIHLGHAVSLRKLQAFTDLSHNVTFLIGDFTALIGDTSDKDSERPALTSEQIQANFKTYKKQAEKILDFSKIKVRYNSEWLDKITSRDFIKLAQQFSFGDFSSRELIKKRLQSGHRVGLHEGLYPAMQGYDSYYLDTDIQIGGTDQTFNMQAGRTLLKNWRNKESFILANEFLAGTDGRKMSKTWNNAIWLEDNPNDMFAKIMSINDDLIIQYFTLLTRVSDEEIETIKERLEKGENPVNIKKVLALEIVGEIHGQIEAGKARAHFEQTVQKKQLPESIRTIGVDKKTKINEQFLITLGLASSISEAKRLFNQGAITLNGHKIGRNQDFHTADDVGDMKLEIQTEKILKAGKRKIVKLILTE